MPKHMKYYVYLHVHYTVSDTYSALHRPKILVSDIPSGEGKTANLFLQCNKKLNRVADDANICQLFHMSLPGDDWGWYEKLKLIVFRENYFFNAYENMQNIRELTSNVWENKKCWNFTHLFRNAAHRANPVAEFTVM